MSIQNEIDGIQSNVSAAYSAVEDKGGTLPDVRNSAGIPAAIRSIPSGGIMLEPIAINAPPAKTAYTAGDSFDPAGMVVTAVYSDGSTKPVSGYAVVAGTFDTLGSQEVHVFYEEGDIAALADVSVTVGRAIISALPTARLW